MAMGTLRLQRCAGVPHLDQSGVRPLPPPVQVPSSHLLAPLPRHVVPDRLTSCLLRQHQVKRHQRGLNSRAPPDRRQRLHCHPQHLAHVPGPRPSTLKYLAHSRS